MIKQVVGATVLAQRTALRDRRSIDADCSRTIHKRSKTILIQVRDGCGAGKHFSPALGRCVVNYGVYGAPGYYGGGGCRISRRYLSWRRLSPRRIRLSRRRSTAAVEWAIAEDIVAVDVASADIPTL